MHIAFGKLRGLVYNVTQVSESVERGRVVALVGVPAWRMLPCLVSCDAT